MKTIPETDIGCVIVDRLVAAFPEPSIFSADEIFDWPDGALPALEAAGLLQKAERAAGALCDGCHWCCHKPVAVRKRASGQAPYAYIICDEEPNLGRIDVPWDRLRQYRTTLNSLAEFLRGTLKLDAKAPLTGSPPYLLGNMKGRWGFCAVSLLLEGRNIMIVVGSHSVRALEILNFHNTQLAVNEPFVRKLSNRKQDPNSTRPRYQPNRTKQEKRASKTAQRDRAILAEARQIQNKTGKTMTEISQDLARRRRFRGTGKGEHQFLTADRIYRIIYDQLKK